MPTYVEPATMTDSLGRLFVLHAGTFVKLPGKARPGDAALVVKRLQTSADTLTRREARKAQTMALAGKGVRKPPKPSSRSRAAGSSAYRPESGACADGFWHALWLDSQK